MLLPNPLAYRYRQQRQPQHQQLARGFFFQARPGITQHGVASSRGVHSCCSAGMALVLVQPWLCWALCWRPPLCRALVVLVVSVHCESYQTLNSQHTSERTRTGCSATSSRLLWVPGFQAC